MFYRSHTQHYIMFWEKKIELIYLKKKDWWYIWFLFKVLILAFEYKIFIKRICVTGIKTPGDKYEVLLLVFWKFQKLSLFGDWKDPKKSNHVFSWFMNSSTGWNHHKNIKKNKSTFWNSKKIDYMPEVSYKKHICLIEKTTQSKGKYKKNYD